MAFPSIGGGVGARPSIAQLGRWLSSWFAGAAAPSTSAPEPTTASHNGDHAPEPVAVALAEPVAQNTVVVAPAQSRARSRVAASKARTSEHGRPTRAAVAQPARTHKARPKAGARKTRGSGAKRRAAANKKHPKTRTGPSRTSK